MPRELLGSEAGDYEKLKDVMDVWADSGVSFDFMAATRPGFDMPADLYLEGSDQHRGWFQSSLLMSEGLYARAPYRGVLTHGFAVDEKGRKMSKSIGNVILPQKVVGSLGADVLRLWVAATDYANEMSVSDALINRTADAYRRMRNTARFLLGNLHGFDPARDLVHPAQMVALDRWAVTRTAQLQAEIIEAYREYAFHLVYHKVHNFCIVDLSAIYLDIVRDRLYTTAAGSHARRSAQSALYHIAHAMVRWLAPVLSFTAEEIWRHLPGTQGDSVFLTQWQALPEGAAHEIDWTAFMNLKRDVSRELEKLREAQQIGAPLDAEVEVYCVPAEFERFNALGAELRFLLITSEASVHKVSARTGGRRTGHGDRARGRVAHRARVEPTQVRTLLASPPRGGRESARIRRSAAAASAISKAPGKSGGSLERRRGARRAHRLGQWLAVAAAGRARHCPGSALEGLDREPHPLWGHPDAAAGAGYHPQVQSGGGLEHAG